jgi:uncharacterized membrane protein YvbJ
MFCQKCGTENKDDGTFCSKCGNTLIIPVEKTSIEKKEPTEQQKAIGKLLAYILIIILMYIFMPQIMDVLTYFINLFIKRIFESAF